MFSYRVYPLLAFYTKLARIFYVTKLGFDPKLGLFYTDNSTRFCWRSKLSLFLTLLLAVECFVAVVFHYKCNNKSWMNLAVIILFAVILFSVFLHLQLFQARELCQATNGYLRLFRFLHGKYLRDVNLRTCKENLLHDGLQLLFTTSMLGFTLFTLGFFALDSRVGIVYMGAYFPRNTYFSVLNVILFLGHAYILVALCICVSMCMSMHFTYDYYLVVFYLGELRLGKKCYRAKGTLRNLGHEVRHIFRCFQLLHTHQVHLAGKYLLLTNAMNMLMLLYNAFVLIKYWDQLNLLAVTLVTLGTLILGVVWSLVLFTGKMLFSRGNMVIRSWGKAGWGSALEKRIMAKFGSSCLPLLWRYGSMFVLRKANLLTFYRGVVKGTVRALLMTKN